MGGKQSKQSQGITEQDKAILDMKIQRDRVHQYQRRITVLTDKETEIAKQMLAKGDKRRALLALRKKKYQESILAKTDAQLNELEKQTQKVEFAQIQKDVLFGLAQGTKVLTDLHAEMGGIDNVEKIMGDSEDAIAYQKEISDMLGNRMTAEDEAEVEDELEALEKEMGAKNEELPTVPSANLPESQKVPEAEPKKEEEERPMVAA